MTMSVEERAKAISALTEMRRAYFDLLDLFRGEEFAPVEEALNNSRATEIYADVFSGSFDEIPLEEWCYRMIRELSTKTYTVYADRDDMTFIMRDTVNGDGKAETECIGWYYGKPNEKDTEHYAGSLIAELD